MLKIFTSFTLHNYYLALPLAIKKLVFLLASWSEGGRNLSRLVHVSESSSREKRIQIDFVCMRFASGVVFVCKNSLDWWKCKGGGVCFFLWLLRGTSICNYFALFLGCPVGWGVVLMLILRFVIYYTSFASFIQCWINVCILILACMSVSLMCPLTLSHPYRKFHLQTFMY